ncbi:hypothetical protein A9Q87_01515 [Flavobacteriales bacterium 34_180_T64]|nr:hypothetical protein A9Q87_01515 [Flavobacteriales bacterium 34_180_T64]
MTITFRQRIFLRYLMAILIDLMILNLFVEFWDAVVIDSFAISILAAFILQILLRVTMMIEHKVANYFKSKPGKLNVFLRWFTAWAILFGSKFIILFVIDVVFGAHVEFSNVIVFIAVIIAIVLFEVGITSLFNLQWMRNTRKPQQVN